MREGMEAAAGAELSEGLRAMLGAGAAAGGGTTSGQSAFAASLSATCVEVDDALGVGQHVLLPAAAKPGWAVAAPSSTIPPAGNVFALVTNLGEFRDGRGEAGGAGCRTEAVAERVSEAVHGNGVVPAFP